jgi:predicted transcriptional regulator
MTQCRSKDGRGAEAIARDRDAESWRVNEIHAGVAELDEGRSVPHAAVVTWLRSWGLRRERKTPRA